MKTIFTILITLLATIGYSQKGITKYVTNNNDTVYIFEKPQAMLALKYAEERPNLLLRSSKTDSLVAELAFTRKKTLNHLASQDEQMIAITSQNLWLMEKANSWQSLWQDEKTKRRATQKTLEEELKDANKDRWLWFGAGGLVGIVLYDILKNSI